MSNNISDIDLITPGSVWLRESGKQSKVICITNTALPAKLAASHPQQVVYIDEEGNFLNVSIDQFLAKRTFFNVDPDFEDKVNNLAVFVDSGDTAQAAENLLNPEGDDDLMLVIDDGDDDSDTGPDDSEESAGTDDEEDDRLEDSDDVDFQNEDQAPYGNLSFVTFNIANDPALPVVVLPDVLANATADYSQNSMPDGSTEHILLIDARIASYEEVRACFSPQNVNTNAIFTFDIDLGRLGGKDASVISVDWDTFMGVVPTVRSCDPYHKVIFTTNAPSAEARDDAYEAEAFAAAERADAKAEAGRQVVHLETDGSPEQAQAVVDAFQAAVLPAPTPITQPAPTVVVSQAKPTVVSVKAAAVDAGAAA